MLEVLSDLSGIVLLSYNCSRHIVNNYQVRIYNGGVCNSRNLIHSFLQKFFAGSWPWPHPLITECSIVRAFQPENVLPDWKLPTKPDMESLQDERAVFYTRLYKKAEEQAIQCWPGLYYSQLQQPPALPPRAVHHPPPPVPPFLVAQNLS